MSSANVSILGGSQVDLVLEPLGRRLADSGMAVSRFHTLDAFLSALPPQPAVDVLVAVGDNKIDRPVMVRLPNLRAIVCPMTGTEGFDEAAATTLGIAVANGQTKENYESMAEAALLLILAASYDLRGSMERCRAGITSKSFRGRLLRGKTVGVIGFGMIAQAVTARLEAFGCRMQVAAPRLRRPLPSNVDLVEVDELMATSDVVCVLCNLNAQTRGMLDDRRLRLLKPDAVLVNVARGGIVDEQALAVLCRERPEIRIAFDVFDTLPLDEHDPLLLLPNATLTAHEVGHTRETLQSILAVAEENVGNVVAGKLPPYLRNPEVKEAWEARWARDTIAC